MKYFGALVLTLFLLGEMFDWFLPVDKADTPGLMRHIKPGDTSHNSSGVLFLGGGLHRGK